MECPPHPSILTLILEWIFEPRSRSSRIIRVDEAHIEALVRGSNPACEKKTYKHVL